MFSRYNTTEKYPDISLKLPRLVATDPTGKCPNVTLKRSRLRCLKHRSHSTLLLGRRPAGCHPLHLLTRKTQLIYRICNLNVSKHTMATFYSVNSAVCAHIHIAFRMNCTNPQIFNLVASLFIIKLISKY